MAPPPRYTQAQRAAITTAVLDDGLSQQEAIRRAKAGDLAADLEPFQMGKDAVSRLIYQAKLDRATELTRSDPTASAQQWTKGMLEALTPSAHRLLQETQTRPKPNHPAIRDMAKSLRDLVSLQRATAPRTQRTPVQGNTPSHTQDTIDIAHLINQATRDTSPARSDALEPDDD